MPELPEVQTTIDKIKRRLVGRRIRGFWASWPRQVSPGIPQVRRAITNRRIQDVTRRGKRIILLLDDGACLTIHLGMTGQLEWTASRGPEPPHLRAEIRLDRNARLWFIDARKFGKIKHVASFEQAQENLGPEPLSRGFTAALLYRILTSRSRQLKPLLMDQSVVAGLGNIYTDESLHRAGLHPEMSSKRLTRQQARRLHASIRRVLRRAIQLAGTSFDWAYPGGRMQTRLRVYGRKGEPCLCCGQPIRRILVGQRSTHFCPRCQARGGRS
jgi:formamidopyrimidine-DNA glycosylase